MQIPRPLNRVRGRIWAGGLLLTAVTAITAAAVTAGPAALAVPLRPAAPSHQAQHASGNGGVQGTVSWSVLPATSKGPDTTRTVFSYGTIKPGSTVVDHVEIVNRSRQGVAFSIYATDATGTTASNALTLLPVGKKPVDIGKWTTFPGGAAQLSTIIPGHKAIIEPFTIAVPQQATPGDHTGGMIAAVAIPHRNDKGQTVLQYQRIAVPMELRVSGAMHAGVQVQSISGGFNDSLNPFGNGSATISYTVANAGNVRQSGSAVVSISGAFGQSATLKAVKLPTVLPGDSVRLSVTIGGLFPVGPMTTHVTVTPGWPPRTPALPTPAPPTSGSGSLFAMPWSLVGLIVLLVAIGVGLWRLLRWRGREHRLEVAAAAAKARRETERRLARTKSVASATEVASGGAPDSGSTAE